MEDYDEVLVKIQYNYQGVTNEWLKKMMRQTMLDTYNMFAKKSNDIIDRVNKAWNALHPNVNLREDDGMWVKYCQFLADCFNEQIVRDINRRRFFSFMSFKFIPDDLFLQGHLKWNKKATIDFVLIPVKK